MRVLAIWTVRVVLTSANQVSLVNCGMDRQDISRSNSYIMMQRLDATTTTTTRVTAAAKQGLDGKNHARWEEKIYAVLLLLLLW
jgi:hypothetical protein